MEKFNLKLFKPGRSEFKRNEHIVNSYLLVLNSFEEARNKNWTWKFLKDSNKNGDRKLFELYFKNGVAKLRPKNNNGPWNDRLTGLFFKENLIEISKEGFIVPGSLGKIFLEKNIEPKPFSLSHFKQLVHSSIIKGRNNISYLNRAINLLLDKEYNTSDEFYFDYLILNYAEKEETINNMLLNNEHKKLFNWLKMSGGNGEKKYKEKIDKWINNLVIQSIYFIKKNNKNFITFFNEIKNLIDLEKKQIQWLNMALKFTFGVNSLKELNKKINNGLLITNKEIIKFLISIDVSKKFNDYKSLIKKYVTSLPLFEEGSNKIQLTKQLINLSKYLLNIRQEIWKSSDLKFIYNKVIPSQFRTNLVNENYFYPKITFSFLEKILSDNKLWKNKIVNKEYKEILPDLNNLNRPTYYEFLTVLYIYKKFSKNQTYYNFEKTINTNLNSKFMPIRFASGGRADALIKEDNIIIMIEPTLVYGREQMKFEVGIINHYKKYNPDYCIMISPDFHETSLEMLDKLRIRTKNSNPKYIYPLKSNNIKDLNLSNLNDFIELKNYLSKIDYFQ